MAAAPTEDEDDILEEWVREIRTKGFEVGRWRPVHVVTDDPPHPQTLDTP